MAASHIYGRPGPWLGTLLTQVVGRTRHLLGCSGTGNIHQGAGKSGCLWKCRNDCLSILLPSLVCNALWSMGVARIKPLASLSVVRRPMALTNLGAYYKCGILDPTPDLLNEDLILARDPGDSCARYI